MAARSVTFSSPASRWIARRIRSSSVSAGGAGASAVETGFPAGGAAQAAGSAAASNSPNRARARKGFTAEIYPAGSGHAPSARTLTPAEFASQRLP